MLTIQLSRLCQSLKHSPCHYVGVPLACSPSVEARSRKHARALSRSLSLSRTTRNTGTAESNTDRCLQVNLSIHNVTTTSPRPDQRLLLLPCDSMQPLERLARDIQCWRFDSRRTGRARASCRRRWDGKVHAPRRSQATTKLRDRRSSRAGVGPSITIK